MRKLIIMLFVALFALGAASQAFSAEHGCGCGFTVTNPSHTQELGGSAGHPAHGGLRVASERSPVIDHRHAPGHTGH